MDADKRRFDLKDQTSQIIGCAMEVLNTLGHGLLEKPYERSLAVEFAARSIPFLVQPRFAVLYKGVNVGDYIPDLIAFDQVIVEIKCIDKITPLEVGQVLNYLRIARLPVALILNFRRSKLDWQRVALSDTNAN